MSVAGCFNYITLYHKSGAEKVESIKETTGKSYTDCRVLPKNLVFEVSTSIDEKLYWCILHVKYT